ncbi:MAG: YbjN domain-containing protein [Deltaproteobacteria bacterium]|nr:YbjN domain-containing protein [Deltaproteobacteria bacterium]
MSITFEQLQDLFRQQSLKFFIDPLHSSIMFGIKGIHGSYHIMGVLGEDNGMFQVKTSQLMFCPADHAHILPMLKAIAHINYQYKIAKFGWDPDDGEIAVYADMVIADGTLTGGQLHRLLGGFLPTLDENVPRLRQILETGKDPGTPSREQVLRAMLDGVPGMPPELRELLEKMKGGRPGGVEPGPDKKDGGGPKKEVDEV